MSIFEIISDFIEDEGRDFRYKIGDKPINLHSDLNFMPIISYEYLNIGILPEFSFVQSEFQSITSEEYPDKSDYNIYFERIKHICSKKLSDLRDEDYTKHFKIINNPKKELVEVVLKILNMRIKSKIL